MSTVEILFAIVEAALWYAFLWFLLDAIRNNRNLWLASLYLLVTTYLGFVACPWVRDTRAWERLFQS